MKGIIKCKHWTMFYNLPVFIAKMHNRKTKIIYIFIHPKKTNSLTRFRIDEGIIKAKGKINYDTQMLLSLFFFTLNVWINFFIILCVVNFLSLLR